MKRLLILAALLILTACTAVTESPTLTASPSPTATATVTSSPTVTPSITPSPTPTEILPTPDFLALPIAENFLFTPDSNSDCQPPCWQGLRVGESGRDEIQVMFDEVFGFDGSQDFFTEPPNLAPIWILDLPDTQTVGHEWHMQSDSFVIVVVTDEDVGTLRGIRFIYSAFEAYKIHTPQQVIQVLGTPDNYYSASNGEIRKNSHKVGLFHA